MKKAHTFKLSEKVSDILDKWAAIGISKTAVVEEAVLRYVESEAGQQKILEVVESLQGLKKEA